jgi:hypothetical protein
MRFRWRSPEHVLRNHAEWVDEIDPKNRRAGTSAPTLASAWSGPMDLVGALATHPDLARVSFGEIIVEAMARFDAYAGNVRNHDLLLRGWADDGRSVVICVEAKAGEPLGNVVSEQARAAQKASAANPRSQALQRLDDLVATYCRFPFCDARVSRLRYQLLTAWAGTIADSVGVTTRSSLSTSSSLISARRTNPPRTAGTSSCSARSSLAARSRAPSHRGVCASPTRPARRPSSTWRISRQISAPRPLSSWANAPTFLGQ